MYAGKLRLTNQHNPPLNPQRGDQDAFQQSNQSNTEGLEPTIVIEIPLKTVI